MTGNGQKGVKIYPPTIRSRPVLPRASKSPAPGLSLFVTGNTPSPTKKPKPTTPKSKPKQTKVKSIKLTPTQSARLVHYAQIAAGFKGLVDLDVGSTPQDNHAFGGLQDDADDLVDGIDDLAKRGVRRFTPEGIEPALKCDGGDEMHIDSAAKPAISGGGSGRKRRAAVGSADGSPTKKTKK